MILYTVGYRRFVNIDELVDRLLFDGVRVLVDVRGSHGSDPMWRDVASKLPREIEYVAAPEFGNPYRWPDYELTFPAAMARYRDLLLGQRRQQLAEFSTTLKPRTCLMCACKQAESCHRSVLAWRLCELNTGIGSVVHIPYDRQGELFS